MVRVINQSSSIHNLFESAGRSIPDLDGHNIRVAERRILWSKIAQAPTSPEEMEAAWRAGKSVVTPEQVAQWEQAQPGEPVAEQTSEEELKQLLTPSTPSKPVPPTGAAHVRRPAPPKPAPIYELPEVKIEPLLYTPGEEDPNYVGASKNIASLIRVANYLSKK
jgi:hypothetical protein